MVADTNPISNQKSTIDYIKNTIIMKSYPSLFVSLSLIAGLVAAHACGQPQKNTGDDRRPLPVRVSTEYPHYYETTDGKSWIPTMINYIVPAGQDEAKAFVTIEEYFRNFSQNGGDALRIWISSPFLEIEDTRAGEYNPVKFARIDRLLALAEKYQLRIKFTLHHIRSISSGEVKQRWANSEVLAAANGGPFQNIQEYISTAEGKAFYLMRAKALADRYRDNRQIFAWELWNEMDAVHDKNWLPFSAEILDSVRQLFPHHLVTQTLGSMHSADAADRYIAYYALPNQPYVSIHRYIDPGHDWEQYAPVTYPVDRLVHEAMSFTQRYVKDKPIVINEIGAVEANHAGPSKLYETDTAGVLLHDMVFAPFFCGAAGSGAMWHWDSYIQRQNLWHHFRRFRELIDGIDPVAERFSPFTADENGVRAYGLDGRTQTLVWCRDTATTWQTELVAGQPAGTLSGLSLRLPESARYTATARVYNPWNGTWDEAQVNEGRVTLPPFRRSAIVLLTKVSDGD